MIASRDIVEELMALPGAALIVQHVQNALAEERRKRQEFYETIDEDDKAEFINGEIVYHSPVALEHNDSTGWTYRLLSTYVEEHDLGHVGIEKLMISLTRNDYEPDVCFFDKEKAQHFQKGQLLFPAPDLAVEVLSKSESALRRDKKTKFEDYENHGVSEYWMIDPDDETVEQHVLEDGKFKLVLKSGEGVIRSQAVKGFAIPVRAIFDAKANRQALLQILTHGV